jgi:hypothetical protein
MVLKKWKCNFSNSLKAELPFRQLVITVVKCTLCSAMFSKVSGGRTLITDHLQVKNKECNGH